TSARAPADGPGRAGGGRAGIPSTPTAAADHPARDYLDASTVHDIVVDAQGRYLRAARAVLAPALTAPTTTAAMAELHRLHTRPETPAPRETAETARARYQALCRWLSGQGHDLGPLAELLDDDDPRGRGRRRR